MTLELYTNTYQDIDGSIIDSDDIVAEFNRVAEFINAWAASADLAQATTVYRYPVVPGPKVDVDPAFGLVQRMVVEFDVETLDLNFKARVDGAPYRLMLVLRFRNRESTFSVGGLVGKSHVFKTNKNVLSPSQQISDGFYSAVVIATYSASNDIFIQAFSDHQPAGTTLAEEDILGSVSV